VGVHGLYAKPPHKRFQCDKGLLGGLVVLTCLQVEKKFLVREGAEPDLMGGKQTARNGAPRGNETRAAPQGVNQ